MLAGKYIYILFFTSQKERLAASTHFLYLCKASQGAKILFTYDFQTWLINTLRSSTMKVTDSQGPTCTIHNERRQAHQAENSGSVWLHC